MVGGRGRDRTGDPLLAKRENEVYLIGSLGFRCPHSRHGFCVDLVLWQLFFLNSPELDSNFVIPCRTRDFGCEFLLL